MHKYYVDSGQLRFVVSAPNEVEALQYALRHCSYGIALGPIIRVNQQGFEEEHEDDLYYPTMPLLERLGLHFDA